MFVKTISWFIFILIANVDGKMYPSHRSARTGKDRLYNAVVDYLVVNQATFKYQESKEMKAVVNALTNLLWVIDGHHSDIFEDPGIFLLFRCLD